MADLSFVFDPSDVTSKAAAASAKAVAGSSNAASVATTIATKSAGWDSGSAAGSKASEASVAAAVAQSKASDASSAIVALDATVIKSVPGIGSRAVHEILYTAASSIKYVYSSNAQA